MSLCKCRSPQMDLEVLELEQEEELWWEEGEEEEEKEGVVEEV